MTDSHPIYTSQLIGQCLHAADFWQTPTAAYSLRSDQIRSDQSLSHVRLFATPGIAACQASLSITNSRSSLRLTSIESVMPSSHLILCRPLLLLPPIPPSLRVFSNESTLRMRWQKYWTFSFSIIPSKEIPGLISLQSKGLSRVFSNTTVQKHQYSLKDPPNLMYPVKIMYLHLPPSVLPPTPVLKEADIAS